MWLFRPDRSNTEGWLNVEQTIIKRKVNWIFSLGSSLVVSVNYSPHRVQGQIGRISQMSVHAAVFTVQQTARLRAKTTTFTPSCVFMFCVACCHSRTVPQSGSTALWKYFLCRVWRGIHMGFDLVMKEGCEGNTSHAVDGDRIHWNKIRIRRWWGVDSWLTPCCFQKTAGGCFCGPTLSVRDETVRSDVITTAYANQLCWPYGQPGI